MSETQTFFAGASVTISVMPHDIWAVWADVNAWKSWNPGIDSTTMHGNFKVGTTFTLQPEDGPPMEVLIKTVTQGEEFSDETELPVGVIRSYHRMEPLGGRVRITHEVEAIISTDAEEKFAGQIWPGLQAGLSAGLLNIADIVGND
jgi:hypothetical protein